MDEILDFVNEKIVKVSHNFGIAPDELGIDELTFSYSVVGGFLIIHFLLYFIAANASSSRDAKFRALSEEKSKELLVRMKARIDEANKPKTKNPALEQSKIELERLKEQRNKILEQHNEVERNCKAGLYFSLISRNHIFFSSSKRSRIQSDCSKSKR
jgi:hypothetical protein